MSGPIRVIVHPPSPTGGRRVRVDGEILDLAHNVADVAEFLPRAGLEIDSADVAESGRSPGARKRSVDRPAASADGAHRARRGST